MTKSVTVRVMHPLTVYRKRKSLTQNALAAQLGVARTTVARWETGSRKIDAGMLTAISEATGIAARELRPDLALLIEDARC